MYHLSNVPMSYTIYTSEFDQTLTGRQLSERDPKSSRPVSWGVTKESLESYLFYSAHFFDNLLPEEMAKFAQSLTDQDWKNLNNTTMTVLADHSGSLMTDGGKGSVITRLTLEILSGVFSLLGVKFEILGFTTVNWQGGNSRKQWMRNGQPALPGRLCDLMHIIYHSYDDIPVGPSPFLSNLFRRDLLKENVDGEAFEWALSRLRQRLNERKVLICLSDGAPVDDSTMMVNQENFLGKHASHVLKQSIVKGDVEFHGIGVNYRLHEWFESSIYLPEEEIIPELIFPFIKRVLKASSQTSAA